MMQAKALYDFTGSTTEELSLFEGEIITLMVENAGDGWSEGKNSHGQTGLVPTNYLEVLDSMPEPSMPPPSLPPMMQLPVTQQPAYNGQSYNLPHAQNAPTRPNNPPTSQQQADSDDSFNDWSSDDGSVTTEQSGGVPRRPTAGRSQNRDSAKSKAVSRLSTHNKLGFDQFLLSNEASKVPEHVKIQILRDSKECAEGWKWEPNLDQYHCNVASPKKASKLKGIKSFIVYQITPSFNGIAVQRRYKHFVWLHERLTEKYPTIVIPPLPDKQVSGRYEEDFINERMRQLQEWVTRMTNHPIVSKSQVFHHFLTNTDEKTWKKGKRDAENDMYKGGRFFLTLVTPPAPLDYDIVDRNIDNFSGFVKKMDDGVRHMIAVGQDQVKKYPHQIRKLHSNVSSSVNTLKEAFVNDGCKGSEGLNHALGETSRAYSEIATMCKDQVQYDWAPLLENLEVYKGILGAFDGTLTCQRIASTKVRENRNKGGVSEAEMSAVTSHADAISYSTYSEVTHFQLNRRDDFKVSMSNFLDQQIDFYRKITTKLEEAKRSYDSL